MRIVTTLLVISLSFGLNAQSFLQPVEATDVMSPMFMKSATAVYPNGDEVVGVKFTSAIMTNGAISSFALKTEAGEKVKFKAADLKELRIEMNGFATFMMSADENSIKASFENYFYEGGKDRNQIVFEQVELKPGKFKLMMLLNPDFDERIKVYLDPQAQETGKGDDKSFFVKKGDRFFKLKKKKYDDEFENLYGDSEIMMKFLTEGQVKDKFKNFAGHISLYNQTFNW